MSDLASDAGAARIRPLALGDAPLMAALHAESFAGMPPWTESAMADLLAMPGAFGFAVTTDARPLGFLLARSAASEAEIISLAVHPEARRRGLARALLQRLIRQVAARGGVRIFLEVAENNVAARCLYGGLAFREVGRRPDYYRSDSGQAIAALIMVYNIDLATS